MGTGISEQCCSLSERWEEISSYVKGTKFVLTVLTFDLGGTAHSGATRDLI